ncbi:hypothetical protein DFH09DRAFT_1077514 [Mycena vulgaris]|nr:hypothetical protein DFH09DRAFT_1077514 [Mycena vulgaris]
MYILEILLRTVPIDLAHLCVAHPEELDAHDSVREQPRLVDVPMLRGGGGVSWNYSRGTPAATTDPMVDSMQLAERLLHGEELDIWHGINDELVKVRYQKQVERSLREVTRGYNIYTATGVPCDIEENIKRLERGVLVRADHKDNRLNTGIVVQRRRMENDERVPGTVSVKYTAVVEPVDVRLNLEEELLGFRFAIMTNFLVLLICQDYLTTTSQI